MLKRIMLLLLIPMFLVFGQDNAKQMYESLNNLSNEKLIHHILVAAKNYQGDFDLNVLIPIKIMMERKGNAVDLLGKALNEKDNYQHDVRVKIAEALGEMKDKKAISYLEQALPQSEPRVASKITESLGMLAGSSKILEMLNKASSFEEKQQALKAILKAGIRGDYSLFNKVMSMAFDKNEHYKIRSQCMGRLGSSFKISSTELEENLKKLVNDTDELDFLKGSAIQALGELKQERNIEFIYSTILTSNSMHVLRSCIRSLALIGTAECDSLIEQLKVKAKDDIFITAKQKEVNLHYLAGYSPDLKKLKISKDDRSVENQGIVLLSDPNSTLLFKTQDIKNIFSDIISKQYISFKQGFNDHNKWMQEHMDQIRRK